MKTMLERMIEEKGIELDNPVDVPNNYGITVKTVLDFIYILPKDLQAKISRTFIKIEICNGDIMDYMKYIANGMATKF